MERLKSTLETAGKIWTYITIPFEAYFLTHGLYTRNLAETTLGAIGLIGDFFVFKWFGREKRNQAAQTSLAELTPRGSQRFSLAT